MTYACFTVEIADHIAHIRFNRPDKANTLRFDMLESFGQKLAEANRDPEVKLIVVAGAGDNFCGGFDFSGQR